MEKVDLRVAVALHKKWQEENCRGCRFANDAKVGKAPEDCCTYPAQLRIQDGDPDRPSLTRCLTRWPKSEIIWLEDVSKQPYVRAQVVLDRRRRGRIAYTGNGRAVGYENLPPDIEGPGPYYRRVFWLAPWDPYEGGGHPTEAIDPRTLARSQR